MIRFWCRCGRQLQAADGDVGREARCPLCDRLTVVPERDEVGPERAWDSERDAEDRGEFTRHDRERDLPVERPRRPPREEEDDDYPRHRRREDAYLLAPEKCGDATKALVFGIAGFVGCQLLSPLAIIFGVRALNQIARSDGRLLGRGEALAGLILGILGLGYGLIVVICIVLFGI